jgi:peptidoglycan hydrolase-like protein with peptidoglycan-binding domain
MKRSGNDRLRGKGNGNRTSKTIGSVSKRPASGSSSAKSSIGGKINTQQYILYGLGTGILLGGGYLVYNLLQDINASKRSTVQPVVNQEVKQIIQVSKENFPLKNGSKGNLVAMLQKALIALGGQAASHIRSTSMKPNGEVDGVFGRGTENALEAAGYAKIVFENDFSKIVGKNAASAAQTNSTGTSLTGNKAIADEIISAANRKNLFAVLAGLQKIQSVSQYSSVSAYFQNQRILGTRVTSLVNALLSVAFASNEPAKVKIRAEFSRIGLKQNAGGVWSLSGLGSLQGYETDAKLLKMAITKRATLLKNGKGQVIQPLLYPDTLIGYVTNEHKGILQILTKNGESVYAPAQNLKLI